MLLLLTKMNFTMDEKDAFDKTKNLPALLNGTQAVGEDDAYKIENISNN